PEVTIDADAWRTVTAIGHGVTVADLGHTLDLTEVSVCRLVRDLVEMGLGTVSDEGPTVAPATTDWAAASGGRFEPIEFEDPAPAAPAAEAASVEPERFEPAPFEPERFEPAASFEPDRFEPASFEPEPAVDEPSDGDVPSLEERRGPVTPVPQREPASASVGLA